MLPWEALDDYKLNLHSPVLAYNLLLPLLFSPLSGIHIFRELKKQTNKNMQQMLLQCLKNLPSGLLQGKLCWSLLINLGRLVLVLLVSKSTFSWLHFYLSTTVS
jgi:hypothetical protein